MEDTWPVTGEIFVAYLLFVLAVAALVMWIYQMVFFAMAWWTCRFRLYRPMRPTSESPIDSPGVSIIKPLLGVDSGTEENLESHFRLDYPRYELLLCIRDEDDPAVGIADKLMKKYPDVQCKILHGGKPGVVNPMVSNMCPGYTESRYPLIWISSSRVRASNEILCDMVARLVSNQRVAICHQLPFVRGDSDSPNCDFAATVEKVCFGSAMAKNYLALNWLGTHVFTGMSYVIRKAYVEEVGGLEKFGRYLAEDFFLSQALHVRGYDLELSAFPAEQIGSRPSLNCHMQRMIRWWRLRLHMLTLATLVLEPLAECTMLGAWTAWALNYLFDCGFWRVLLPHLALWICLDYLQLRRIQGCQPLPFGFARFLAAWCYKELLNVLVFCQGLLRPHTVHWGGKSYRVGWGGLSSVNA